MKVLLTGASGFIGGNLAAALRRDGHTVVPVCRRHGQDLGRLLTPTDWLPLLEGVETAINCVGIIGETAGQRFETLHARAPSALFGACVQAGVRRVIQVSALGADALAFSPYHLSKRAADELLRGLDLDWFVLRPSLTYGKGGGSAELFLRLAALPRLPVIDDGRQRLQPVHVADVVDTALRCLAAPATRRTIDIVGDDCVAFADWLQWLRAARGLPPARLWRVPYRLALTAFHLLRHLDPILQPANLRMLRAGYRGDPRPLADFLGRPARRFEPRLVLCDALGAGSPS